MILDLFKRPPDFVIGEPDEPYLLRWWIIPRNKYFNIYLHKILRDDDDRALHDHPWHNCSLILKGGYWEIFNSNPFMTVYKWRKPLRLYFRKATRAHRLVVQKQPKLLETWSLFITGPVIRNWGFHCPKGWVPWQEFVDERDAGKTGKGCEE